MNRQQVITQPMWRRAPRLTSGPSPGTLAEKQEIESLPKFYKVLEKGRIATAASTNFQYPWRGVWTSPVTPRVCESGYHVVTAAHASDWFFKGDEIWEVEVRGDHDVDHAVGVRRRPVKYAFESIRLVRKVVSSRESKKFFRIDSDGDDIIRCGALRDFLREDAKKNS